MYLIEICLKEIPVERSPMRKNTSASIIKVSNSYLVFGISYDNVCVIKEKSKRRSRAYIELWMRRVVAKHDVASSYHFLICTLDEGINKRQGTILGSFFYLIRPNNSNSRNIKPRLHIKSFELLKLITEN